MKNYLKLLTLTFVALLILNSCKKEDNDPMLEIPTPIAYYPFNGNANDQSGNGYNSEVFGAELTNDRFGNKDKAFSFDGENDYMNFGNIINFDKNFSFSGWYYLNPAVKNWNSFFVKNTYCEFGIMYRNFLDEGNKVIRIFNGTCEGLRSNDLDITLQPNQWIHLVLTYDGNKIKLYLDGEVVNQFNYSENIEDGNDLIIGASKNDNDDFVYFWKGSVDDIRIYDYAISDDDVEALYTEK